MREMWRCKTCSKWRAVFIQFRRDKKEWTWVWKQLIVKYFSKTFVQKCSISPLLIFIQSINNFVSYIFVLIFEKTRTVSTISRICMNEVNFEKITHFYKNRYQKVRIWLLSKISLYLSSWLELKFRLKFTLP